MHVCVSVNPEQLLPRLKALAPLVGSHFPSPILQSVQLKILEDGRGVLRATNQDAEAEVEVPLLKVIRPGAVQLPMFSVLRALADATTRSKVEIHGLLPDTLPFMADPNVPSRKVVVRTRETSVTLPTWDPDDFPALTPVELTEAIEIAAWKFRRLLTPTPAHFATAAAAAAVDQDSARRQVLGGCTFEFKDDSPPCIATEGSRCFAPAFNDATGTAIITPPTKTVADVNRLLVSAIPSQALKALTALLDMMENAALTLGFTSDPEEKFQVQGPGLLFVSRLIRDKRFALQAANRPETQSVTEQKSKQEVPPVVDEALSLRPRSSTRTLTMAVPKKKRDEQKPAVAPHKDRPVRVIRMKNIRGNVWANQLPGGQVIYNVTIDRLWRDDDETNDGGEVTKKGEWHQSQSFGRDDLLLVAKVADLCHTWIFDRTEADSRDRNF